MGARRTAPNVVNTPTGTRPTREDERERMPIADDPVTRPSFFRSPAQERSASRTRARSKAADATTNGRATRSKATFIC